MKIRNAFLKHSLAALCSVFVATAAMGQTVRVWDGGDGTGTNLGAATNWVGDVLPATTSGTVGDFATWDGLVAGNLVLTYNGGMSSGFQQPGVNFVLTPNQSGSVTIVSPVSSSATLAVGNFLTNSTASASLQFGDGTANVLNIIWRSTPANPPYDPHYFINNSATPNVIRPNVRFQAGGGNPHTIVFGGSGDWYITNNLKGANGPATTIIKSDAGTMIWSGPSIAAALGPNAISSPVDIRGGTLILKYPGLLDTQRITNNGTMLQYDGSAAQTLSGPIHGTGKIRVSSGTLTLSSSQSDFTGNVELNGGTLTVGGLQNEGGTGPLGIGGTIVFGGGTLGFSVNNIYDYSPRFSTAAGQAYSLDSGGQSVLLTNDLASSGATLTKSGSGTITLGGVSSFSGLTTVSGGKLVFQGAKTGSGNISVAGSTTLGITATGSQVTPATLTTSAGAILEFNNVSSTTTALLAAGTVSASGSITVNVNSGTFALGQSYPLVSWTSGSPTFALGTLTGAGGNLSVVGNTLYLNITSLAYVWTGLTDGNWDTTTANNWTVNGVSQLWGDGNTALFDDSALGQTNVVLNAPVSPASITVNSSAKIYSITSSGANRIGGSGSLTKSGNSTLTMSGGVNTFSGVTTIGGGVLSVGALANGGAASDIGAAPNGSANLVLNGGALQYTGGAASVDRLFTLGTGNGAIDASGSDALNLNNTGVIALSGSGARTLTLRGSSTADNTLAAVLGDNGGATALAKSGSGKWILTGNNTNSGAVTIAAGTLQVGAGGASGAVGSGNITANGNLIFNRTGTLTNGTISGSGSVTVDGGGKVVLPGNNSYTGGTTINTGSTLQVGNGGGTGSLSTGNSIVNNGTLIFDTTGSFSYLGGGVISGTGNVIMRGNGGLVKIIGANSYTGWTLIEPGATLQPTEGNTGGLASPVVTNNGTLKFVNQVDSTFTYGGSIVGTGMVLKDGNNGLSYDIPLTGTNTYTGGTFIAHGGFILGDGSTPGAGAIAGDVVFTNSAVAETARSLTFNRPDDFTFPGLITYSASLPFGNRGIVRQNGGGMLTLTANNDYPGGTEINGGTLQVGDGGATGAIGSGPVTDNTLLIFNRSGSLTIDAAINGGGSVVKTGSGTVTLNALNLYSGSTTVSNGTLIINSNNASSSTMVYGGTLGGVGAFFAPVTLEAGTTLAPGASASSIGTFTFNSDLTIGGNVAVKVNKSLAQSNDLVSVSGTLSKTGSGTLTVANLGPDLVVGDKFFLFNQALPNGTALTVTGAGATWQNDLATDGSITALTVTPQVNTNAPVVQVSVSGTSLSLAWPTNRGWTLQTNSVAINAVNQWFSYPGSETITNVNFIINPAKTNVFFRMVYTNTP